MGIKQKYHNFWQNYGINFKFEPDICYDKNNCLT